MQTLSKGFWDRYDRLSITEEAPPDSEEKVFKECNSFSTKTIDKWDIKVYPEMQPNLIQLVFDPNA